ncbi:MAG TPA: response regulator [Verrucomicrobiae bacterium]|nr:response regulator [Verrucomicrobiae bacterium]
MKTLLFVDDEVKVLQGLQRQLRAMRNDWDMHFVENSAAALTFMATTPVDVIVTDMMMPGMDGSQLLTEVSRHYPHSIRIVLSGHAEREAVLRLVGPAHQYLSKPCDADELRNAIARAFALRDLHANERLKQLTTRIKTLPSLPALHQQLTAELQKDEASLERVSEIISRDMGMTTKILQLVNSAFFGLPQKINSPQEAVMYLGITTVRSLVLSLQVFSQFEKNSLPGFSLDALASHGWMTGVCARRIARMEHQENQMLDQCFLAGLLHDVGQLVLAGGLPDEYAVVLQTAHANKLPVWRAEQDHFGVTHAEVGAYLLGLWGLPNPIIESVARHHHPSLSATPGFSAVIAVHAADAFAHDDDAAEHELDSAYLTKLGFGERLELWREVCTTNDND